MRYNLLFKWFLDLNVEDEPFNATTFSKNRERLLEAEVARAFFAEVVAAAGRRRLLSDDHFSVDGTLLEAWASLKSYRPRDEQEPPATPGAGGRNPEVDFRGQRRSRETHVARNDRGRRSAIDGRTTRHPGYGQSLQTAQAGGGGLRLAEDSRAVGASCATSDGSAIAPGWS